MNEVARLALEKLLRLAENAAGKGSEKGISLLFSEKSLAPYHAFDTNAGKQACNAVLIRAASEGAIRIEWDHRAGERAHVTRAFLEDPELLAGFLGVTPRWNAVATAQSAFAPHLETLPILLELLDKWRLGQRPKGTAPADYQDWLDAVRVIEHCRNETREDIPVRRLSALLMEDSKRIEGLYAVIDAIWKGDIEAPSRSQEEVFSDIGLVKFPPTFLIAGKLGVSYGGAPGAVMMPYMGFAPSHIDRFNIDPECVGVLTIENLTTFHEAAARRLENQNLVILYTGGMPSRTWVTAYGKLIENIPEDAILWHWGDIDIGGFRIANRIARVAEEHGKRLIPHMMGGKMGNIPEASRHQMTPSEVVQITKICELNGWREERGWVEQHKLAIEQESLELVFPTFNDNQP